MAREDLIQTEGVVVDVMAHGQYGVKLSNGKTINAKLSGRMRKFSIKVIAGDRVTIGLSPYDPTHVVQDARPGSPASISANASSASCNRCS